MSKRANRLLVLGLFALLLAGGCAAQDEQLEGLEEPIEPNRAPRIELPKDEGVFIKTAPAARSKGRAGATARQQDKQTAANPLALPSLSSLNLYVELSAAALVLLYIAIIVIGRRSNKRTAEAWARTFAMHGGIMDKNFSYTGPKETGALLMEESGNVFKFYASGRRYCSGLLAELQLLARQDALSMLWNLLNPTEDQIKVEVYMHDTHMPPIVLAIATPKVARAMQRDMQDIIRYTKRIQVSKDAFPAGERLWILAEHSSIFTDLFSDPKLQQLFSFNGPSGGAMKYFRSMHVTSENSEGTHKQVLRFWFKLPPSSDMAALASLMELVPLFIDIVGTYKLPADLKKRALDVRAKQAEDDEEVRRKRQEALMQKKMEKMQEERAKLARMAPEARQKAEEKLQRQQAKKAMKGRVVRM